MMYTPALKMYSDHIRICSKPYFVEYSCFGLRVMTINQAKV